MQTDNQIINMEKASLHDLQNIVNAHPAFGLAQLFLAKKLKSSEQYEKQIQRTVLHFNNVFWLNFLLTDFTEEEKNIAEEKIDATEDEEMNLNESTVAEEAPLAENRLASILQAQAADFKKPVAQHEHLPIETEPLYKTDYFASQGIIFTKPQDALGNKVKKFTDWLRDVKKTNSGVPQLNTTEEEERRAEAQAMASLKVEEVITEPMAEVLVQQNKKQQAIELYRKLSLLYPEKSAYFAAKINSLQ